eukprot:TRINITY_DN5875_c0_g1_i2.p1 TRINITY_DN5875_c0_g1~~TRINITY_DN5875_c0_g1_i2.p1  ORF type:complete len:139 (-),score=25.55 TRINITY_DN5875_c0_g1_i2:135-551(-)
MLFCRLVYHLRMGKKPSSSQTSGFATVSKAPSGDDSPQGPVSTMRNGTVHVSVRAKPNSHQEGISDWSADCITLAVTAAPHDGEANDALQRLLAKLLDLPRRDVVLVSGGKSRNKIFAVSSLPAQQVCELLMQHHDGK